MPRPIQLRRAAMRDRIRSYVRRRLLPRLGLTGDFRLTPATKGRRSIVIFLDCGEKRFVLKCHTELLRGLRTWFAHRQFEKKGAPVPELLIADFSPRTFLELGCIVLVEEAIDGAILAELERNDAQIEVAAEALAKLHEIREPGFGAVVPLPFVRRRKGYVEQVLRRLKRRLTSLSTVERRLRPLTANAVLDWFRAFEPRIEDGSQYELSHLRMTGTNVMLAADGEAKIIDLVTSRYARCGFDLVSVLHRWCRSEEQTEVFLARYFATRRSLDRSQFERDYAFYHAFFHFSQAHDHGEIVVRLRDKLKRQGKTDWAKLRFSTERIRQHLRSAYESIRDSDVAISPHVLEAIRAMTLGGRHGSRFSLPPGFPQVHAPRAAPRDPEVERGARHDEDRAAALTEIQ
jgi:aminoglycoside/choline kinase family phosphotransferase